MDATMFRKPKRNFRRKGTTSELGSDEEGGDKQDENEVEEKIIAKTPQEKKVKNKSKSATSVLSFEVDEDGDGHTEIFKVKKSSASRRIAKQIKKEKQRLEKQSQNGSTVDTDDSNDEDRESSSNSRKIENAKKKKKETEDEQRRAEEKIRQLREEFRTMNGDEAEAAEGSDDDDGQKIFKNMLARGEIPDSKTIHYIRKQRQMARNTDSFIPLQEEEKTKSSTSTARLVRDDDNDKSDDDDEENNRMDFSVDQAARDRQQIRDDFLAAEHGSDEESDQDREWETQQIKKAVSLQIPGVEVVMSSPQRSAVHFESSMDRPAMTDGGDQPSVKPFSGIQDSSEINIEIVRKKLQERLSIMDSVYRTHKLEHEQTVSDLTSTQESEELCQSKVSLLENRYRFFQELRGYVRDLVDCLNEKVPILQDLEQRVNSLLKMRATRLLQRRQQDVQDQCREYMTSLYFSHIASSVHFVEPIIRQHTN